MITSLKVKGFRGIEEGELSDLSRVNILVGSNNSGKSSILEAINMLYSLTNEVGVFGEDIIENLARIRVRRTAYYPSLWYKYDDESPIEYEIGFDSGLELNADFDKRRRWLIKKPSFKVKIGERDRFTEEEVMLKLLQYGPFGAAIYLLFGIDDGREIGKSFLIRDLRPELQSHRVTNRVDCDKLLNSLGGLKSIIIDAEMVKNFAIIEKEVFPTILQKREDKKLIEILNEAYETEIEGLSYMPFSREKEEKKEEYALLLMLKDYSVRIDEFGDGVKHAVAILSILLGVDISLLLLEEPEMHQHPKAFSYLAKSLSSLTAKARTQMFITTHNLELIDAFLDTFKEEDVSLYHLSLRDGKLDARKIETPDAKVLDDLGIDVRSLERYM
ncbi:MAG: AAA family ATPase [Halobacteriota archaeon]